MLIILDTKTDEGRSAAMSIMDGLCVGAGRPIRSHRELQNDAAKGDAWAAEQVALGDELRRISKW